MKCCGSSTTFTAPDRPARPPANAFVEATLFAAALRPLAASLGFMGETVVDTVARDLFLPMTERGDVRS